MGAMKQSQLGGNETGSPHEVGARAYEGEGLFVQVRPELIERRSRDEIGTTTKNQAQMGIHQ